MGLVEGDPFRKPPESSLKGLEQRQTQEDSLREISLKEESLAVQDDEEDSTSRECMEALSEGEASVSEEQEDPTQPGTELPSSHPHVDSQRGELLKGSHVSGEDGSSKDASDTPKKNSSSIGSRVHGDWSSDTLFVAPFSESDKGGVTGYTTPSNFPEGDFPSGEKRIGRFLIIKLLATGGMGEIFLVQDPTCGRLVALKRIKGKYAGVERLHSRFVQEAQLAAQLCHPSIMPIFEMHFDEKVAYYIMPYIRGSTLKQHFIRARKSSKMRSSHEASRQVSSFLQYFLRVCEGIAHAHVRGILHRDLKPENVIIGAYGEVVIADWGLAERIQSCAEEMDFPEEEENLLFPFSDRKSQSKDLTRPGQVAGTVAYLAPERILGEEASLATDIYACGVILYQILTLKMPYHRVGGKHLKKFIAEETILPPSVIAPDRDISPVLERITMRCLENQPQLRYASMQELIHDLQEYIEGGEQWSQVASLDVNRKEEWRINIEVPLTKVLGVSSPLHDMEWVHIILSTQMFSGSCRLETSVYIKEGSGGVGLLFNVPKQNESFHPEEGYCLWLAAEGKGVTSLSRSNIELFEDRKVWLSFQQWHSIRVEHVDNHISLFVDGHLCFTYVAPITIASGYVGLLRKDGESVLKPIHVFTAGMQRVLGCLAVPDAFFAHGDYENAAIQYQEISTSFAGHYEGRVARFKSGISYLERGKQLGECPEKEKNLHKALQEFSLLSQTADAPLEYLGKALAYEAMNDEEEEVKSFEMAIRKYHDHPLLGVVKEQLYFRLHTASKQSRSMTYRLLLLVSHLLPDLFVAKETQELIHALEEYWELIPFFSDSEVVSPSDLVVRLCFWLGYPEYALENLKNIPHETHHSVIDNGIFSLIYWGHVRRAVEFCRKHSIEYPISILTKSQDSQLIEGAWEEWIINSSKKAWTPRNERIFLFMMQCALEHRYHALIDQMAKNAILRKGDAQGIHRVEGILSLSLLLQGREEEVQHIFDRNSSFSPDDLSHPLFAPYILHLAQTQGNDRAIAHTERVVQYLYPPTTSFMALALYLQSHPQRKDLIAHFLPYERRVFSMVEKYFREWAQLTHGWTSR